MPYDQSLDKLLFKEVKELGDTRLTVGIYSYNGGEKKLQLSRENQDASGEWRFAKLGRMTKQEAGEVIPAMMQAIQNME